MKKLVILSAGLLIAVQGFCGTQTCSVLRRLSSLKFEVSAQLHTVHGQSKSFSGTLTGDPADITTARIHVVLEPASLDTENEKRDKQLRQECLEVDKYPGIEFESTSITSDQSQLKQGQPVSATVKGKLKMHGMEKEITVPVKVTLKGDEITAEGEMGVVLDDWKILRPKVLFVQVQNDVKINFTIGARCAQ